MTRWDSPRTIDRMSAIINPERKKEQESPFGALIEALVPSSPKRNNKNASKKRKGRVSMRNQRKSLSKKVKGSASV